MRNFVSAIITFAELSVVLSFQPSQPSRQIRTLRQDLANTSLQNTIQPWNEILEKLIPSPPSTKNAVTVVDQFYNAWNSRDYDGMMDQFADECAYEDTQFPGPFEGKAIIERQFRLLADSSSTNEVVVLDDKAVSADGDKIGVKYHLEVDGKVLPDSRHCAFFTVIQNKDEKGEGGQLIQSAFDIVEPARKTGNIDLAVLSAVSRVLVGNEDKTETTSLASDNPISLNQVTAPQKFYQAWNRRDIDGAMDVFAEDCIYEDTVFPEPFVGKDRVKGHFLSCADAFPSSFRFVADDIADGGDRVGVSWHVESKGTPLPFTRGCSFYEIDPKTGLIERGFDEVEPAVFKLGAVSRFVKSMRMKIGEEPIRLVPTAVWAAYMYVVFFSDGILPGANALQLEGRTWEEVRDLSLNFFFVSPLLNLPIAAVVHPILEGVFNLLLAWAALFAGFLSDERRDKPNLFPMVPAVVGMQFLTSAFLLPYLATRTSEKNIVASLEEEEELPFAAKFVGESRLLGPFLGTVGTGALFWGALARTNEFGAGFAERTDSFWQLMSIDRVGSSFLVDLAIFALFQGWLVDDDLRRRGVANDDLVGLRRIAKYVPFFGLAVYLTLRPGFAQKES